MDIEHDDELTTDDLRRIDAFIRDCQRARELAPVLAARRKAEAAQAAADQRRRALYGRAAEAARVWNGGRPLDPLVLRLQQHVVDLSLIEPIVPLGWLAPGTRSERIVSRDGKAIAFCDGGIVCPPIVDRPTGVVPLHELGHQRTPAVRGRLFREAAAWQWARRHALMWGEPEQTRMVGSVGTYIATVQGVGEVPGLLALEALISPTEYRRERQRRLMAALAEEQGLPPVN